jgi:casein kinase II subunit alpha
MLIYVLALSSTYSESSQLCLESEDLHSQYPIEYRDPSDIEFLDQIGHGRFSLVYKAKLSNSSTIVAAKKLKPLESWRLKREVEFLTILKDAPNILHLIGVYGDAYDPIIVTELCDHESNPTTLSDIKWLLSSLLKCLNATHRIHIFHRDIKLQNLLSSFSDRKLRVIDWGLAEWVIADHKYSYRVGTKSYKAPELLMKSPVYGPGIDIWSAGVVLANLIFGCPSFFAGNDDKMVLHRHVQLFGHVRMRRIAKSLGYEKVIPYYGRQSLLEFVLPHARNFITRESLDMVQCLLVPEMGKRITAAEALMHSFFSDL